MQPIARILKSRRKALMVPNRCTLVVLIGIFAIAVHRPHVRAADDLSLRMMQEWHPRESLGTYGARFLSYDPETKHLIAADNSMLAVASIGEDRELKLLQR